MIDTPFWGILKLRRRAVSGRRYLSGILLI